MIPLKNPDKKSIESIVNKSFDHISKKIDDIELLHICSKLEEIYTFIDTPPENVDFYEGETILKNGEDIGEIYKLDIDENGDIFIPNFEILKGNGANVIAKLFCDSKVKSISGEATNESKGFWKKFGAIFGKRIKANETTEFVITKNKFFRYYKSYLKDSGKWFKNDY